MLKKLIPGLFSKKQVRFCVNINELNPNSLPILNADEIIESLHLHNQIRKLKRQIGLDSERFELLYLKPLKLYFESAQLIPASISHHHSTLGGLILHTLQVIEKAIAIRNNYTLPQSSSPETQQKERQLWTYGVFVASLLHDSGKMLSQQKLILDNHSIFDPINPEIKEITYRMQPLNLTDGYRIHETISTIFFGNFIPLTAQSWLSSNLSLLDQLFSFLKGDKAHQGIIGEIVTGADRKSTASDVGFVKTDTPIFSNVSFSEKLMTATREVVKNMQRNHTGAPIFIKNGYAWIMSKTLADTVRKYLQNHKESVPSNNNNIFTEYQNTGLAVNNGRNGVTLSINIKLDNWQNKFNVIAFKTKDIFPDSFQIEDFEGLIECLTVPELTVEDAKLIKMQENSPAINSNIESKLETDNIEPTLDNDDIESTVYEMPSDDYMPDEDSFKLDSSAPNLEDSPDPIFEDNIAPNSKEDNIETKLEQPPPEYNHEYKLEKRDNFNLEQLPKLPEDINVQSNEILDIFLKWVTENIRLKRYILNDKTSPFHILSPDIIGLMAPKAFIDFLKDYNLTNEIPVSNFQTRFYKKGITYQYKRTGGRKVNVFSAKIINTNKSLSFVLIPQKIVMPHGMDINVNKSLVLQDVPELPTKKR